MVGNRSLVAMRALGVAAWAVAGATQVASAQVSLAHRAQPGSYPLDGEARNIGPREALPCGRHPLVTYRGESIKYSTSARVHPAFVEHLRLLEMVISQVAVEFYGRAPRRLVHLGTHNCRQIRAYPGWVSEHSFGNAIDLAGFDFGPLPRGRQQTVAAPQGMPRNLGSNFQVRMAEHWNGRGTRNAYHSRFLRAVAQRLIDQPGLFRAILGPAWPGHHNHFHLDMAPYRMVEVF